MQPVTQTEGMSTLHSRVAGSLAAVAALFSLAACDLPFGLGLPSTRTLEAGAGATLSDADSLEITGSYADTSARWTIDLQFARRPNGQHVTATASSKDGGQDVKLEAINIGATTYFRGQQFLAQHMGNDQLSQNLVQVAGNSWWRSTAPTFPQLPDFTDGTSFRSTFLGTAVTKRTDHMTVDGVPAIEMSSPRADVFISAVAPYQVLRVHMLKGAMVDGISEADFRFTNFNQDFKIVAPVDVIDFSNLSTLPPVYTVVSVDTSGCGSPCVLSASLKNIGGSVGARAPSTVTFTVTDPATGKTAGSCKVQVVPDVGYNSTTSAGCTIADLNTQQLNAATVTATVTNPGRG
jgi:hypothetical protein